MYRFPALTDILHSLLYNDVRLMEYMWGGERMQEWIIAMLAISVLLILRDMAKTFLSGKIRGMQETAAAKTVPPSSERGDQYAECFQKLAETFYGMPYRREGLSQAQVEAILENSCGQICRNCFQQELCWDRQLDPMKEEAESLIRALESGSDEKISYAQKRWMGRCGRYPLFFQTLQDEFRKEKEEMVWNNRLIENRLAVAGQLMETASIIRMLADRSKEPCVMEPELQSSLRKSLRKRHIQLKKGWTRETGAGNLQYDLSLKTRGSRCISVGEAAKALSEECGTMMTSVAGGRSIINGEYHTLSFVREVNYQVIYGAARMTREGEKVSGDNFICFQNEERFVMCLSDGMGSGRDACQESERVVDLLEQFLETGFSLETAARMVNATLILKGEDEIFSTMDLCSVDLDTGFCSFLKAGAATTFVRRGHWVETIASENLALGLMQQLDFEKTARKLYHGDLLVMISDGVLDALPVTREEEILREIILGLAEAGPKETSREILERVLGYCDYHPRDDMTVLTARITRK